jgi:hypothetical protein
MAKTNANDQHQALPQKIEQRLAELHSLGEFDQGDLAHCRRSYWAARADWHKILVDCYDAAMARQQAAGASPQEPDSAPARAACAASAPAARAASQLAQGVPA